MMQRTLFTVRQFGPEPNGTIDNLIQYVYTHNM